MLRLGQAQVLNDFSVLCGEELPAEEDEDAEEGNATRSERADRRHMSARNNIDERVPTFDFNLPGKAPRPINLVIGT